MNAGVLNTGVLVAGVLAYGGIVDRHLSARPPVRPSAQIESLLVAGQRLARAWSRHDFAGLTSGSADLVLDVPGAPAPGPQRPAQASELLRAYTEGATEVTVDVVVAREVDRDRAYVEVQRVYAARGTAVRRQQTIYFGLRRSGATYRLYEVRVVP